MSAEEFAKVWHLLNEASCEVIDARAALNPDVERARLRSALVQVRKAEAAMLKLLGAG